MKMEKNLTEKLTLYQRSVQDSESLVPYDQFCAAYNSANGGDGWPGRKVVAIPMFIYSATVPVVYHLSLALWALANSIYKAVMESPEVKKAFDTVDQDFYKAWGYLTTVFHDCYGQYWVESSNHQQMLNWGEEIQKPIPLPPPPPPPPAPPKRLVRVSSTGDLSGLSRDWNPKPRGELIQTIEAGAISMEELLDKAAEIRNAKRSQAERKPELPTPEKDRMKNMFNVAMIERRKRLVASPSLSSEKKPPHQRGPVRGSVRKNLLEKFGDTKKPVVLGDTVGPGEGSGFDLSGMGGD